MAISMADIKKLKEKTGAAIVDCKKVLQETDSDFDKAVAILKEKGLAKAAKKAGRAANEGRIVIKISDDHKKGLIVKVNCETDFVAKTPDFEAFAQKVADLLFEKEYAYSEELPEDLEAIRKEIIAKLGENILISEWSLITEGHWLYPYIHNNKIGVIVDYSADKYVADDAESEDFMKKVAMQVTAMAPVSVSIDDIPAAELEEKKNSFMDEAKETGKPEKILEKIVEGKMKKYYGESVLLEQIFMLDEEQKLTVKDIIDQYNKSKDVNAKVDSFVRISL